MNKDTLRDWALFFFGLPAIFLAIYLVGWLVVALWAVSKVATIVVGWALVSLFTVVTCPKGGGPIG